MSDQRVRRTFVSPPGDWRAVCPATGEILECRDLVTLLQQIARAMAFTPKHGWKVEPND